MSDYGSTLKITKKKGKFIFFERNNMVKQVLDQVEKWDYKDALSKRFQCKKMKTDQKNEIYILLSEFWYGEGEDEENFAFCKKGDEFNATKLIDLLSQKYRDHYTFEWLFENW